MYSDETAYNNDYTAYRINDNAKGNLEYYYQANLVLTVFALGAFAFYISTGVSRGVFLFLDIFLSYKAIKILITARKNKDKIDSIGENITYLKGILFYNIIFLAEAFNRHFLELNITIVEYLMITAATYVTICVISKFVKKFNKDKAYEAIANNSYEKIILFKRNKEKIFTITAFFIILLLVLIKFMEIVKGGGFIAVMTFFYGLIILMAMDIKSEVEIEHSLLVNGDIKNIERVVFENQFDEEELEESEEELKENNIDYEKINLEKANESLDNTATFDFKEELDSTMSFDNNYLEKDKLEKEVVENDEEVIKSRVERNRGKKKSFISEIENFHYEKYIDKIKVAEEKTKEISEKGKNLGNKGKEIKNNLAEKIKAIRKRIDRDK
ncbi:MAG: hypothetical protein ACRDD2_03275 [Sarcina sp.]